MQIDFSCVKYEVGNVTTRLHTYLETIMFQILPVTV